MTAEKNVFLKKKNVYRLLLPLQGFTHAKKKLFY